MNPLDHDGWAMGQHVIYDAPAVPSQTDLTPGQKKVMIAVLVFAGVSAIGMITDMARNSWVRPEPGSVVEVRR